MGIYLNSIVHIRNMHIWICWVLRWRRLYSAQKKWNEMYFAGHKISCSRCVWLQHTIFRHKASNKKIQWWNYPLTSNWSKETISKKKKYEYAANGIFWRFLRRFFLKQCDGVHGFTHTIGVGESAQHFCFKRHFTVAGQRT